MKYKCTKYIFKLFLYSSICFNSLYQSYANEGMWPISKVRELIADSLKNYDFKLTPEAIYSVNNPSLKDAVVIFGKGCTGEMVSGQGLLFTNHHCGYSAIQSLSSIENNLLKDGYWAKNKEKELPVNDLSVSFLIRFDDITDTVLRRISGPLNYKTREKLVTKITDSIAKVAKENDKYEVEIKECFSGLQYFLAVYKVYKDVRLVGVPPTSIGKFGGETDNWMWPRHSGDFSIFRVYADSAGNPAKYNISNIPLKPRRYFPISLKGFKKNELSIVLGFPGSTNRYSSSYEVEEIEDAVNDPRITMRNIRLNIMRESMDRDSSVNLKYAAKYSSSGNYYKYSIGQNKAIEALSVIERKKKLEKQFDEWVHSDSARVKKYGKCLSRLDSLITIRASYYRAVQYYSETFYRNMELYGFVRLFIALHDEMKSQKKDSARISESFHTLIAEASRFYRNIDYKTEKQIAIESVESFSEKVELHFKFPSLLRWEGTKQNAIDKNLNKIYKKTIFFDSVKIKQVLAKRNFYALENDPMFIFASEILSKYRDIYAFFNEIKAKVKWEQSLYLSGLFEMTPAMARYPDANSSMRLSYGSIKGYCPRDAVYYDYVTTLDGLIAKGDATKKDFEVNERLRKLYLEQDFGQYEQSGSVPVDFLSTNDNTGGSSGSPVLNKDGEIIGITFDGNWEGMSRDLLYEPELQRAISVDIRYVLFLIDKFGDAGYLFKELDIKK